MTVLRGLLLGGACGVGILSWSAIVDIGNAASVVKSGSNVPLVRIADNSSTPAWAAPAKMNPDYVNDEAPEAQVADDSSKATTNYYGGEAAPSNPAWAAPAKMNPDYQSDQNAEAPAPAPTAEEPAAAASGDKATTNYYGGSAAPANPAWAAPAKMNPDYESGGAAEAPKAAASDEAPPAASGDKATTNYYGDKAAPSNPAWAAPATMNPDYSNAAAPAAQPAATPSEPAAAPVRNAAVEACRAALTEAVPSVKLHFAESSYDVPASSRGALKKIAKIIGDCDGVVVEVNAFTDNTGGTESNLKLSERRANAVVKFLTSAGVDASKLKAVGNGESRPITTNSTAEGRRKNRRVEFVVLGQ
jgi:outer membrane protein OmpA-like peptidoglycan-associated protein